jgi:hypothetical protein
MDLSAQQDHKDTRGLKGSRDLKVLMDPLDHREPLDYRGSKDHRDLMAQPDLKGLWGPREYRVLKVLLVRLELRVLKATVV